MISGTFLGIGHSGKGQASGLRAAEADAESCHIFVVSEMSPRCLTPRPAGLLLNLKKVTIVQAPCYLPRPSN